MTQITDIDIDLNIYKTFLLISYKELDLSVWNMKYEKNNRMWEWVTYKNFLVHSYVLCLEETLWVFSQMPLAKQKLLVLVLIQEYLLGNWW